MTARDPGPLRASAARSPRRALRVCVLENADDPAEEDWFAIRDLAELLPDHHVERYELDFPTAVEQVRALSARGYDVFVNLCDGMQDDGRAGIEVVRELERNRVAFTGARSDFYDPSREAMKLACAAAGIDTPSYAFVLDPTDARGAARNLNFPLIVKPPHGSASVGISRTSRVAGPAELAIELARTTGEFGGALVEEFIDGRELTVLVTEDARGKPHTYRPLEVQFPPGETFKHYNLKWRTYEDMRWVPVTDDTLAARAENLSARLFAALGGSGYARCDLRLAADGCLFMLEINPNCGIFYLPEAPSSADLILEAAPGGPSGFLDLLIERALRRRRIALAGRAAGARSRTRRRL